MTVTNEAVPPCPGAPWAVLCSPRRAALQELPGLERSRVCRELESSKRAAAQPRAGGPSRGPAAAAAEPACGARAPRALPWRENRNELVHVLLFGRSISLAVIKVLETSKGTKYKPCFQNYQFVDRISIDREMSYGTKH